MGRGHQKDGVDVPSLVCLPMENFLDLGLTVSGNGQVV
jgi:hypothetical protein